MSFARKSFYFIGLYIVIPVLASLFFLEIYSRLYSLRVASNLSSNNDPDQLSKKIAFSARPQHLNLIVGDSFGSYNINRHSNLFDRALACNSSDCQTLNLSVPGAGLDHYFSISNKVLSLRPNKTTHIYIVVYLGNDLVFPRFSKHTRISTTDNTECTRIFTTPSLPRVNAKELIKIRLHSLSILASVYKHLIIPNKKTFYSRLYSQVAYLNHQFGYAIPPVLDLSQIRSNVLDAASRDQINPWELSISLSNPYYYEDLYFLSTTTTSHIFDCTIASYRANLRYLRSRYPASSISMILIPDKIYWTRSSYHDNLPQYLDMGYKFSAQPAIHSAMDTPYVSRLIAFLRSESISVFLLSSALPSSFSSKPFFFNYDMHLNDLAHSTFVSALRRWRTQLSP